MGVKGGFYIECGGQDCASRNPRRGRSQLGKPDHGRVLGVVERNERGMAQWNQAARYAELASRWGAQGVDEEGVDWVDLDFYWPRMNVDVQVTEGDDGYDTDYRVTCDWCRRVWVFMVDELTERHVDLAGRQPPVAVAGVDVGKAVGR